MKLKRKKAVKASTQNTEARDSMLESSEQEGVLHQAPEPMPEPDLGATVGAPAVVAVVRDVTASPSD